MFLALTTAHKSHDLLHDNHSMTDGLCRLGKPSYQAITLGLPGTGVLAQYTTGCLLLRAYQQGKSIVFDTEWYSAAAHASSMQLWLYPSEHAQQASPVTTQQLYITSMHTMPSLAYLSMVAALQVWETGR